MKTKGLDKKFDPGEVISKHYTAGAVVVESAGTSNSGRSA